MTIQSQDKRKAKASGWDMGIADAKRRIKELRFTIRIFTERKKRGEPWPGEATQN
jgi:hypothetical protein